jgi:hypothetical protein
VLDANILIRAILRPGNPRRLLCQPILTSALALGCPIWTDDTDFFGCGVATWTCNNVEIFLGD